MVIRPPIGEPAFQEDEYWFLKKTLYGLRRSPHHLYNTIKGIILNMGLKDSPHYPRLLSDVISNPSYPETISEAQYQLHVGLYVNDFVFLFLRSNPGGPIQDITIRTHPSQFHGIC